MAALALPDTAQAASFDEVRKLAASDVKANDKFGSQVAVNGDTAIVGASGDDSGGISSGAAYVFERNEGGADNWGEVKKLTASDAQIGDRFGFSVAVSGDTAIVGAMFEASGGTNSGAAYVFERDEGGADNWGEVKKLTASDAQTGDQFGWSVAVSDDTVIVGARFGDTGGLAKGAAYVFHRNEGGADNWGEMKKLRASDAQKFDQFGASVSVSGDTTIIGASEEDAGGVDAGAAYVFQRNQGGPDNWGEVKKLTASDADASDRFGNSVAISDDTVVVGEQFGDAGGLPVGAAYVFYRNEGGADNWGEVKKLTTSDAQNHDRFGSSVAVSGDTTVVGADGEHTSGPSTGAAYVFRRNQGGPDNWGEVDKLTASDADEFDKFGISVAVSGDMPIVGADQEDARGVDAGAAYVFQEPTPPVGGISLDTNLRALPLETSQPSIPPWSIVAVTVAFLLALSGTAWYARRQHFDQ
ncbi:MAG: FG-GAP repeat protein [Chloroflexi bacterium]|nr:FG-GAP repeat protein [Chloroflexota bacterium]